MSIIGKNENKKIIDLIKSISINTMDQVVKEVEADSIWLHARPATTEAIVNSILDNLYTEKLKRLMNKTPDGIYIKSIIKPTFNSMLNLIDYNKQTTAMEAMKLQVYDNGVIDALSNILIKEVRTYKNIVAPDIKNTIEFIKTHMRTERSVEDNINDTFTIKLVEIVESFNLIKDKGWVNPLMNYGITSISKPLDIGEVSLSNIKSDLEIGVFVKDEFNALSDIGMVNEYIYDMLKITDLSIFRTMLNKPLHLEVNKKIGLLIVLNELLTIMDDETNEYKFVAGLINATIENINLSIKDYDRYKDLNAVIFGHKVNNGNVTLVAFKENFEKLRDSIGSDVFDVLKGLAVERKLFDKEDNVNFDIFYADDLTLEKDRLKHLFKMYTDSKKLIDKNNLVNKLRTYYKIALSKSELGCIRNNTKELETIIDANEITNLSDIDNFVVKLYKHASIGRSNFKYFADYVDEAKTYMDDIKNTETLAYAILKLTILYITEQTEIV